MRDTVTSFRNYCYHKSIFKWLFTIYHRCYVWSKSVLQFWRLLRHNQMDFSNVATIYVEIKEFRAQWRVIYYDRINLLVSSTAPAPELLTTFHFFFFYLVICLLLFYLFTFVLLILWIKKMLLSLFKYKYFFSKSYILQ